MNRRGDTPEKQVGMNNLCADPMGRETVRTPRLSGRAFSVRELERLATQTRLEGDRYSRERIDLEILSMLEQKIYRKLMQQSRRKRAPQRGAAA